MACCLAAPNHCLNQCLIYHHSSMEFCSSYPRTMLQEMLKIQICKMSLKNVLVKLQLHLPGSSNLMSSFLHPALVNYSLVELTKVQYCEPGLPNHMNFLIRYIISTQCKDYFMCNTSGNSLVKKQLQGCPANERWCYTFSVCALPKGDAVTM